MLWEHPRSHGRSLAELPKVTISKITHQLILKLKVSINCNVQLPAPSPLHSASAGNVGIKWRHNKNKKAACKQHNLSIDQDTVTCIAQVSTYHCTSLFIHHYNSNLFCEKSLWKAVHNFHHFAADSMSSSVFLPPIMASWYSVVFYHSWPPTNLEASYIHINTFWARTHPWGPLHPIPLLGNQAACSCTAINQGGALHSFQEATDFHSSCTNWSHWREGK